MEKMVDMMMEEEEYAFKDRLGRLIVGGIAAFIAKELAMKAYDAFIIGRREDS